MTRRKKVLIGLGGLTVLAAVVVGTAWAVLALVKTTATDTVTAQSIGNVDIGNAETIGLFSADLSGIAPGDTFTECTTAQLAADSSAPDPRVWFSGAGGALADDLHVTVELAIGTTFTGNRPTCPSLTYTQAYDGTVAGLLSAKGSYANGIPWPAINPTTGASNVAVKMTLTLPSTVDAQAVMGQTAAFAGNFENRASAP